MFLPPWRDRKPDGSLGETYGPSSSNAYARAVAEHEDWSWRPGNTSRKDADALRALLATEHVPPREREVYDLVFEQGLNVSAAALRLGISAETAKTYVKRLRARLR